MSWNGVQSLSSAAVVAVVCVVLVMGPRDGSAPAPRAGRAAGYPHAAAIILGGAIVAAARNVH